MCATSYSYATKSPVFFASDDISPATLNAVKAGGYSQAVILGGSAAVREKAFTQLEDLGLNVRRSAGPSAYETAVSFANWALEQGMTVNNMAVADINGYLTGTLAGPLAGKANSVVLYGANPGESPRTSTADFIKKQAAQINSGYVLGAIANPEWNPTPKTPWQDMSGETAVDTMASIVQAGWQDNCGGTVIVSNISGYWDALAASALAGATGAPVLLTDGTALSPQARAEINRIKPSSIYIVGGTAVVSNGVEAELRTLAPNLERFAGENAILTAEAICAKVNELKKAKTCIVATVNGFYDSLSIAPGAFALNMPIYLTASDNKLAATTMQAIKAAGYQNAVIVGGHAAVSPAVEKQLQDSGVGTVKRLSGENAWQTSAAIAEWELSQGMQADNMGVADGNGFWDALSGAALCGKNNAILILVPHDDGVFAYDPYCINKIVKPNAHKIKKSCVFGGLAVIPQATRDALSAALG